MEFRLNLPVMESVDYALGLSGADLLAEGDVALEARKQRQHRDSLLIPLKSLIYINWLKSDLHSDSVWISCRVPRSSHVNANPQPK